MWPLNTSAFLMIYLFLSFLHFLDFLLTYVNNRLRFRGTLRTFSSVVLIYCWHLPTFYMYRCSEFSHVHHRLIRFTATFLSLEKVFRSGTIVLPDLQMTRWSKSHLSLKHVILLWQAVQFSLQGPRNSRGSQEFLYLWLYRNYQCLIRSCLSHPSLKTPSQVLKRCFVVSSILCRQN